MRSDDWQPMETAPAATSYNCFWFTKYQAPWGGDQEKRICAWALHPPDPTAAERWRTLPNGRCTQLYNYWAQALSDPAGSEGLYDPEHEHQRTAPVDGA